MGFFYIDDSVHDGGNFVLGAMVYSDIDVSTNINKIFNCHGLHSDNFEFKSNTNYSKEPEK